MGAGWPTGPTPPMAWPVHSRTERASARVTCDDPTSAAIWGSETRWAPLVSTSSGAPSALKIRLLAMAPTSQPSWAAAVAAVGAGSGSSRTWPGTPRSRSTAANDAKSTPMPGRLAGLARTGQRLERRPGGSPSPPPAQLGQPPLAEPVGLLQMRVAGQDEFGDTQRGVLLDQVGHLLE